MNIILVYDTKESFNLQNDSFYLDFSYLTEVSNVKKQLEKLGHNVKMVISKDFFEFIKNTDRISYDLIFNMAEGYKSRNREGLIPALCENFGLPYTGSDCFGTSLSLHKFQTGIYINTLNINTPKSALFDKNYSDINDVLNIDWTFPLVVKPNHEGSSMGLKICNNHLELKENIMYDCSTYNQEIIIQEYIDGLDVSVCLLQSNNDISVFGVLQYLTNERNEIPLFDNYTKKQENHIMTFAKLPLNTINQLKRDSIRIHKALQLNDFSRIDWKVSSDKTPYFLEATPLPDLEKNAEFEYIAHSRGQEFSDVLKQIIDSALRRYQYE